jgi:hypothetical protein
MANISAVFTLTLLLFFNVLDIYLLSIVIFKKDIFNFIELTPEIEIGIVFIVICLGIFNYFKLAYKGKSLKIAEEFKYIQGKKNKIYSISVLLYVILTFGIFFYIMLFVPSPIVFHG